MSSARPDVVAPDWLQVAEPDWPNKDDRLVPDCNCCSRVLESVPSASASVWRVCDVSDALVPGVLAVPLGGGPGGGPPPGPPGPPAPPAPWTPWPDAIAVAICVSWSSLRSGASSGLWLLRSCFTDDSRSSSLTPLAVAKELSVAPESSWVFRSSVESPSSWAVFSNVSAGGPFGRWVADVCVSALVLEEDPRAEMVILTSFSWV